MSNRGASSSHAPGTREITYYVENLPPHVDHDRLRYSVTRRWTLPTIDRLTDVFTPERQNISGRYGLLRFSGVRNPTDLRIALDSMYIGTSAIRCSLVRPEKARPPPSTMDDLELTTTMDVDGMTQFSDLPSCLVMDILSRLPITSLVTCRCVCKDWIRLFRDPYFIQLQVAASPLHILNRYIWKEDGIVKFGEFMEDKCDGDLELKMLNLPAKVDLRTLLHASPSKYGRYRWINSCNGLLCLVADEYIYRSSQSATSVCVCSVCNPILGEWVSISTPVRKNFHYLSHNISLGFSEKNNQYKLLHSFQTKEVEGYGYEIYTLGGTRQWRSIHQTLGCRPGSFHDSDTLSHGSLHWINDPEKQDFICCFDIDNEKFGRLSLPSREGKSSNVLELGVINGCLCALYSQTDPMEIWSMKEYGEEKSWAVMHTIHVSQVSLARPLFSPNEEEFLMYVWNAGLISYNLKTERCRRERFPEKKSYYDFDFAYKPSFISLQDVARGEEVILSKNHANNPIEGGLEDSGFTIFEGSMRHSSC